TAGGVSAYRIAKWDGNSWTAFGSGMNGTSARVYAIAVATSGAELYAGGFFTTAGGKTSPNAARASLFNTPPLSYSAWAAAFGLTGAATAADADPDGDRLRNGVEYILGGNPTVSNTVALPS